jgi:hypothetical protein
MLENVLENQLFLYTLLEVTTLILIVIVIKINRTQSRFLFSNQRPVIGGW